MLVECPQMLDCTRAPPLLSLAALVELPKGDTGYVRRGRAFFSWWSVMISSGDANENAEAVFCQHCCMQGMVLPMEQCQLGKEGT